MHLTNRVCCQIVEGGCPDYHQYRTSGDIQNNFPRWMSNAQTVAAYATTGRTGPTCWAYPGDPPISTLIYFLLPLTLLEKVVCLSSNCGRVQIC